MKNTFQQSWIKVFIGPYCEIGDNLFGISNNTMRPIADKWLVPWIKDSATNKFDMNKWNDGFFIRIKDFVAKAAENGIVVEVTLFTSYYRDQQWSTSPFNPANNIHGLDPISFKQVNTLGNGALMDVQERYVRKVVKELNAFGNIIFEIQNEPWVDNRILFGKITGTDTLTYPHGWQRLVEIANTESLEWQKRISQIIADEESRPVNKHLIAQNISNFQYIIENADPNVSIFNFHYAYPEAATQNLGLQKAIGLDKTGFMPHDNFIYRSQAWKFMLAGGSLDNNLDYSFTVGSEDGTFPIDSFIPGWGGVECRGQLKVLKNFIESFDFVKMRPNNQALQVLKGDLKAFQVLSETGKQYAIYLENGKLAELSIQLPDGEYNIEWINLISGIVELSETITAINGNAKLNCPDFHEDIAVRMQKAR